MLNPVRRWKDGDIYYADDDIILLAFVVTDDPGMVGKLGWHGPDKICVEYVSRKAVSNWENT